MVYKFLLFFAKKCCCFFKLFKPQNFGKFRTPKITEPSNVGHLNNKAFREKEWGFPKIQNK